MNVSEMVENGPARASASEASVDIDSYKVAAILALVLVAILAVGVHLIINALRLRRDTSPAAPPTAAIGADYYARTLQQAAELVGGEANLATALQVPPHALRRWLEREESPPSEFHLAALELITRRTGKSPKRRTRALRSAATTR
jgi:hypothetical protein